MLQQTQVATATPYWERWMARWPTVADLASAPLEEVLGAWSGLGYYARARNIHAAAQRIVAEHGGVFPSDPDRLRTLPGVGRYTAAAVSSIAFGRDVALVDANVVRVLCRYDALEGDPKAASVQEILWDRAGALLPAGRAGDFNQALMELGALVCQPEPRCGDCPWQEDCRGKATGDPKHFPKFGPKAGFTSQTHVCAVVRRRDAVLMVRRPLGGLWGGLWELPRVTLADGESPEAGAQRACRDIVGIEGRAGDVLASHRHGVTTKRITLVAIACTVDADAEPFSVGCDATAWVEPSGRSNYALSSPQARIWEKVVGSGAGQARLDFSG